MLNALQIIDLNKGQTVYNLQFAKEVKQCNEIERKLLLIKKSCEEFGVKLISPDAQFLYVKAREALCINKKVSN